MGFDEQRASTSSQRWALSFGMSVELTAPVPSPVKSRRRPGLGGETLRELSERFQVLPELNVAERRRLRAGPRANAGRVVRPAEIATITEGSWHPPTHRHQPTPRHLEVAIAEPPAGLVHGHQPRAGGLRQASRRCSPEPYMRRRRGRHRPRTATALAGDGAFLDDQIGMLGPAVTDHNVIDRTRLAHPTATSPPPARHYYASSNTSMGWPAADE